MGSSQQNIPKSKSLARTLMLTSALSASLLTGYATQARADEQLVLVATIDVGGKGLGAFDISWVDPAIDLYVLSDRTNGSIDFVDASDNTFIGRVGGFKGVVLNPDGTANNALSGPDGVTIVDHKQVWAGDGDSTLKVIDIASFQIIDSISTGGKFRVDEMAWDSRDHIIAAANNADTPPFVTLVNTDTHAIVGKITFDGTNGTPDATKTGIEQSQWSPSTGMFYISVPQIDPNNPAQGGISVIDPSSMKVVATYPVTNCSPAGLTLGPHDQALIGCSASFGTSPNVLTQSLVINIRNGDVVQSFPQVGGSDEVWYDRGTQHYYLAARNNTDNTGKIIPVLGFIDAKTNAFDGTVPTSTTAHSVAADLFSHHVFVPIGFVPPGSPPGTDSTNPCPTSGCIAVYLPSAIDDDDLGTRQAQR
jgi:hypothetical protein